MSDLLVLTKLFLTFVFLWVGLVIFIRGWRGGAITAPWLTLFSGSVCGLLWAFGVFD